LPKNLANVGKTVAFVRQLTNMKISEAIRKLNKAGCHFLSHGANHDWWYSTTTKKKFQVPRHQTQEFTSKTKGEIQTGLQRFARDLSQITFA
jgi:hypothetical protein